MQLLGEIRFTVESISEGSEIASVTIFWCTEIVLHFTQFIHSWARIVCIHFNGKLFLWRKPLLASTLQTDKLWTQISLTSTFRDSHILIFLQVLMLFLGCKISTSLPYDQVAVMSDKTLKDMIQNYSLPAYRNIQSPTITSWLSTRDLKLFLIWGRIFNLIWGFRLTAKKREKLELSIAKLRVWVEMELSWGSIELN